MEKIIYCIEKSLRHKVSLPLPFRKTSSIKEIYKKNYPFVVFDSEFLKKRKLNLSQLFDKICFIHFPKDDKKNVKILKKYGFFDYFTSEDTKERVRFRLRCAEKLLVFKKKISDLEGQLVERDKRIEKVILIDPLTGCHNWRYFYHRAQQELSRARRHLHNISFIVIDIDYFRQINEVYGVNVGDVVIKEMVGILKEAIRKEDTLCRWMEDEFFIILPHSSKENSSQVARRMKDTISTRKFKYKKFSLNIKVSMGVVSFPTDNIYNTKDIVSALHSCLSLAKSKGGNNIVLFSGPHQRYYDGQKDKTEIHGFKTKIEKLNALLTRDLLEMIYGFARAIEAKDSYTGRHVEYTALVAEKIAQELRLPHSEIENVKHAAVLHDLGKVGIDESILSKKGPLTVKEREIIKTHPWTAAEILRDIHALRGAIPAILYHHERYDGQGYPLGLKGEEIPLSARIVALADVYQALVSDRPYRRAYSKKKAVEIIKKETGTHFDPKIAKIFLKVISKIK
ncbi:MAG: diguanylate cyclase [Candidatus Omnitrophota bacterium]|nr:diguanylate cyclase [Candidatus Omnitrophota bacterium]